MNSDFEWICTAIIASIKAGDAINKIYQNDFEIQLKDDKSPLTLADMESDRIIHESLAPSPYPYLSEETSAVSFDIRKTWEKFWLVDPLDGTKEFIKRNGEFTVNIALIENRKPIVGIIYIPVTDVLYYSVKGMGVFKCYGQSILSLGYDGFLDSRHKLIHKELSVKEVGIFVSRSHIDDETLEWISKSSTLKLQKTQQKSVGSSIKFCYLAERNAHAYPRFAPTMEWDTAAGQAILEESGGRIIEADSGNSLCYNKEKLVNPAFLAFAPMVDYLY